MRWPGWTTGGSRLWPTRMVGMGVSVVIEGTSWDSQETSAVEGQDGWELRVQQKKGGGNS